ncbi:MAG: 2-amino-4-hydroxy-6-hydroxymethyldihydropteridine diphosphokinase [Thermodesulfobacteriota bacterium]
MKNIAYIGLGSNQGDKIKYCNEAIKEISKYKGNLILDRSSFYRTEPWGKEDQDWFINCVIKLQTLLGAPELFKVLQKIETKLKRVKRDRWGPRTIDLDILFFNNEVINKPEVRIPHSMIQARKFELVPLSEICPELIHPVLNKSVMELLEETKDDKEVIRIEKKD